MNWNQKLEKLSLRSNKMNDLLKSLHWLPQPFAITTNLDDYHFLRLAYMHGNATSPDPSTKNGAVLVSKKHKIIAYATNRFPTGIAEIESRLDNRPIKYRMVVHAEHGAILNAARNGKSTNETILYCPFYACSECAKSIIQAGIQRVIGHAQIMAIGATHNTWIQSIKYGWEMMQEAGVECVLFNGIFGITARFNYKDIAI